MGSINRFYFHSFVIRRGVGIGGTNKRRYIATGTIDAHFQPIDDRNSTVDAQVYGATHRLWCDVSMDIRDGDKVYDTDGNEYLVVAIRTDGFDWAMNEHKEVVLRKYNG